MKSKTCPKCGKEKLTTMFNGRQLCLSCGWKSNSTKQKTKKGRELAPKWLVETGKNLVILWKHKDPATVVFTRGVFIGRCVERGQKTAQRV